MVYVWKFTRIFLSRATYCWTTKCCYRLLWVLPLQFTWNLGSLILVWFAFRCVMVKAMISDIKLKTKNRSSTSASQVLLQGVKSKRYTPLMKRQKCGRYRIAKYWNLSCCFFFFCFRKFRRQNSTFYQEKKTTNYKQLIFHIHTTVIKVINRNLLTNNYSFTRATFNGNNAPFLHHN